MNEKTTLYIEPMLKEQVQIQLIKNKEKQSLSNLVNKVLEKWINEQR